MAGVIANPAFPFDEIRHTPGGPQTGLVSQGLGAAFQSAFDPPHVFGAQARLASGASGALEAGGSRCRHLVRPPVHGLAMHTHATGDLRFAESLHQQASRSQPAAFQSEEIATHSSWVSHTVHHSKGPRICHYILRNSLVVLAFITRASRVTRGFHLRARRLSEQPMGDTECQCAGARFGP